MRTAGLVALALASAAFGAAVTGWTMATASPPAAPRAALTATGYTGPAEVPLGGLAGGLAPPMAATMANPLGNGPDVVAKGKQLFSAMNCAGCHGYDGSGGMGPPLNDAYWRYGGTPVQIFKTLYEGRPKGMPAWGHALPPEDLWQLTAFVQSLGKAPVVPDKAMAARETNAGSGDTAKAASPALEGQ